ncbi:MAG TPA: hypothetical protein VFV80_14145 [Geminicoccaceae bacterium]|nr:hypothetical protein [Geminicoccaceae bacterium]
MTDPGRIIAICEREWPEAQDDCNKFVKAVAGALDITLTGNADMIVDQIVGPGWTRLADGKAAAQEAALGALVIGGLKGSDQEVPSAHGHVVVVVRGPLNRDKYPTAYWGRLGGGGARNKTINWSWRSGDQDRVIYGAHPVPAAIG